MQVLGTSTSYASAVSSVFLWQEKVMNKHIPNEADVISDWVIMEDSSVAK